MRSSSMFSLCLALTTLTQPGCSFLGLDVLPIDECTSDDDCNGLELEEAPADDCHTWQCNPTTRHCEIDVLDRDRDGSPAMFSPTMLACMATPVDCSDDPMTDRHAASMFPGNPEVCDGLDSDCDGFIDQADVNPRLVDRPFTNIAGNAESAVVASGGGLDGNEAAAVVLIAGTPRRLVAVDHEGMDQALDLRVGAASTVPLRLAGIAPVGQRWGVLYVPGGACDRLVLASLRLTPSLEIVVDATLHESGLPTLPADQCNITAGALARSRAADRSALVAYAAARGTCDAAGESPVHVVVAQFPNTGTPTLGIPFTLGDTADWVAPAVVSIGAGIYAVAYPTAAGTIEVQRVDAGAGTASLLYTEPAGALPPSGVQLGFDGTTGLALTFSVDCGRRPSEVRFLSLGSDGTAITADMRVALGSSNDTTSATYQPALDEWLFLSTGVLGWRGQRLDGSFASIGEAFDLRPLTNATVPAVRALTTSAAYEVFGANAGRMSPPAATSLDTLGCLPPP